MENGKIKLAAGEQNLVEMEMQKESSRQAVIYRSFEH